MSQLKTAMKVRKKRTLIPALACAIVQDGRVYFSDLDMSASVPTTLADGFYNPDSLLNGLLLFKLRPMLMRVN